jgi:RNA polymerase sigma factor (sigma-70 family)
MRHSEVKFEATHPVSRFARALQSYPMSPVDELQWFNAEVKPCEPALRAYLHNRFPALSDHDDLVQEAYVRLLSARRKGKLTCTKAFLFTVTRNLAIDMFRRRQSNPAHEPIAEFAALPLLDQSLEVDEVSEIQQRHEALIAAVVSLPARCREVMMLRHMDGMSYKEIAERLGISPNTVRVHLVKGVCDCTTFFRRQGLLGAPEVPEPAKSAEDPNE